MIDKIASELGRNLSEMVRCLDGQSLSSLKLDMENGMVLSMRKNEKPGKSFGTWNVSVKCPGR